MEEKQIKDMTRSEIIFELAKYAHPLWFKEMICNPDTEFLREFLISYKQNEQHARMG